MSTLERRPDNTYPEAGISKTTVQSIGRPAVSGSLTSVSPEAIPAQTESEQMYARVLPMSEFDNYLDKDEEGALNIFVVGDKTVKIDDHELDLSEHELYIFNVLLKLRDRPQFPSAIKAHGYHPKKATVKVRDGKFSTNLSNLSAILGLAAGRQVIVETFYDKSTKYPQYQLDPAVVVTDRRGRPRTTPTPNKKHLYNRVETKTRKSDDDIKDIPFQILEANYGALNEISQATDSLITSDNSPDFNVDDALGTYMSKIGQYPLLEKQEQVNALYRDIAAGREALASLGYPENLENLPPDIEATLLAAMIAYRTMFLSNTRLVIKIAHERKSYEKMDLIMEGNEGLKKAIARYDPERGFKFSTYATWWIKQTMQRATAYQARTIRISVKLDSQASELSQTEAILTETLGRKPSIDELKEATNFDEDLIHTLRIFGPTELASLDAPLKDDGQSVTLLDVADAHSYGRVSDETIASLSDSEELNRLFYRHGGVLSDMQKAVLTGSYNLKVAFFRDIQIVKADGTAITYDELFKALPPGREPTLKELSDILGYSYQYMAQTKESAILDLRQAVLSARTTKNTSS